MLLTDFQRIRVEAYVLTCLLLTRNSKNFDFFRKIGVTLHIASSICECNKQYKNMTEKKNPTAAQMKEYRDLRRSMTTSSDYEKVQAFENEYDIFTKVFTENGKMGVKDAAGEVLVPALYDEVGCTFADYCKGFAVPVALNDKMALVSQDGKGTLKTGFDYDHIVFDDSYYVLVKEGKTGLATGGGSIIIPAEMDKMYTPINDLVAFEKDGKFGFAMIGYNLITEPEYDSYDIETEWEYLQVVKDGVTGYIDERGCFTTDEDERFFNAACDM